MKRFISVLPFWLALVAWTIFATDPGPAKAPRRVYDVVWEYHANYPVLGAPLPQDHVTLIAVDAEDAIYRCREKVAAWTTFSNHFNAFIEVRLTNTLTP